LIFNNFYVDDYIGKKLPENIKIGLSHKVFPCAFCITKQLVRFKVNKQIVISIVLIPNA